MKNLQKSGFMKNDITLKPIKILLSKVHTIVLESLPKFCFHFKFISFELAEKPSVKSGSTGPGRLIPGFDCIVKNKYFFVH